MLLTKRELPVLVVNLLYIPVFTAIAWGGKRTTSSFSTWL